MFKNVRMFNLSLGKNGCHRQRCAGGPNYLEKDEIVLKMNLTLGDQEILSLPLMSKLRRLSKTVAR
jgi:hypothetical protein